MISAETKIKINVIKPISSISGQDNVMIKEQYKYSELTGKIIGCAMEVHKILGNGFQACLPKGSSARRQEVIYQRALAKEMSLQGLAFSREHEMPIFYKEDQIGTRRVDFLVEDVISVEI